MVDVCFQVAVVCNNAVITNDKLLGQPTEGALLFAAMKVSYMCCKLSVRWGFDSTLMNFLLF